MNAPAATKVLELGIPAFLQPPQPKEEAVYLWSSAHCLVVIRDGDSVTLTADDLHRLFNFVDDCKIEEQI
jgi:hypothetical protein